MISEETISLVREALDALEAVRESEATRHLRKLMRRGDHEKLHGPLASCVFWAHGYLDALQDLEEADTATEELAFSKIQRARSAYMGERFRNEE